MMVKQSTVSIDPVGLRAWLDARAETFSEIGEAIGKGASYISDCLRREAMPEKVYKLFLRVFDLPDGSFLRIEQTPVGPVLGYSPDLIVKPDRVRVALLFNGTTVVSSYARIKNDTELALIQAISYASHMCYKLKEQDTLQSK